MWHGAPWLIDHGSALYFHHAPGWEGEAQRPDAPFERIRDHVLLASANALADADRALARSLTPKVIADVLAFVPDTWLGDTTVDSAARRRAYERYFASRLEAPRHFVEEAARAR
jgi:hypothetical protein